MIKNLVLWVENEPEKLADFQRDIEEDYNIKFVIKKDAQSAIEYLKDNIEMLSAAVLDIESFINPKSEEETKTSFCRVRDYINKLEHRNKIEYFAFTGKGKYLADKAGFKEEYGCEIKDKNYQGLEAEQLLNTIVERHKIARISSLYGDVFSEIQPIRGELLGILEILEGHEYRNADVYNKIRKVLDWVMEYCYNIGISQVKFTGTNLADCSIFIGDSRMSEIVPIYIQRSFHSAVTIANEGSHRLLIDEDTKAGRCPYLIRSTVFELLNILNWLNTVPYDEESVEIRRQKTEAISKQPRNTYKKQNQ